LPGNTSELCFTLMANFIAKLPTIFVSREVSLRVVVSSSPISKPKAYSSQLSEPTSLF
jgi:hypothetical protein